MIEAAGQLLTIISTMYPVPSLCDGNEHRLLRPTLARRIKGDLRQRRCVGLVVTVDESRVGQERYSAQMSRSGGNWGRGDEGPFGESGAH